VFVTPGPLTLPVTADVVGVASWQCTVKYARTRLTFARVEFAEGWSGSSNATDPGVVRVNAFTPRGTVACKPLAWLSFDARASYGNTTVTLANVVCGSETGDALAITGGTQTITVTRDG
jgi:hypothetical protein